MTNERGPYFWRLAAKPSIPTLSVSLCPRRSRTVEPVLVRPSSVLLCSDKLSEVGALARNLQRSPPYFTVDKYAAAVPVAGKNRVFLVPTLVLVYALLRHLSRAPELLVLVYFVLDLEIEILADMHEASFGHCPSIIEWSSSLLCGCF
jgi:hypothetical protein